jgi:ribosome-binding factor A
MSKRTNSENATGPSQRQLRVGEMLRHSLAELLSRREIHDDVLTSSVITVAEVRMSPDLKLATAYVMPLGGGNAAPVLEALDRNKRYIRTSIAKAVKLKYAPDLRFRADERFDEALHIESLLNSPEVRRDIDGD